MRLSGFDARIISTDRRSVRTSLGLRKNQIGVLTIARLISWKGLEDLIRAVAFLPNNVQLYIVGWGPIEHQLRSLAKNEGVVDRVHFLLSRSDVPELLAASDLYVQAHRYASDGRVWEGPNTSQMEACAALLPSVSTAVPRIERLIEDGLTGVLAEPNNPRDLARAIDSLIKDPSWAFALAKAARGRVEECYSTDIMARNYQLLYELARR